MVDVFDRASTLNFVVVARLRPAPSETGLRDALARLATRHPLLIARVERQAQGLRFAPGSATIPLTLSDGDEPEVTRLTATMLDHRLWQDDAAHAELRQVNHGDGSASLLLCLHHLVSDGSSGVLAMRDLIALCADPSLFLPTIDSPGLHRFMPPGHGDMGWRARALGLLMSGLVQSKPYRLRREPREPSEPRTSRLIIVTLEATALAALQRRARREGASVHGVLAAAAARAVAHTANRTMIPARLLHPVDLRRYLRAYYPALPHPGEAVGYYVSSVETDHRVDLTQPLGALAREVSTAIRAAKERGTPLLTAPLLGPWLTKRVTQAGHLFKFRDRVERSLVIDTFGLTNLGLLERLGAAPKVEPYRVEALYVAAAGSVLSTLGAAASTFGGKLTVTVQWLEPLVSSEEGEKVAAHFKAELDTYAHAGDGPMAGEIAFESASP